MICVGNFVVSDQYRNCIAMVGIVLFELEFHSSGWNCYHPGCYRLEFTPVVET
jgi:hypothetical protein